MANYYMCLSVFKFALPIILIVCMAFRPCLLSAIYLLLLLLIPWLPVPTIQSMSGITGIYLKIVIAISVIGLVAQVAFQVVLFSLPPYAHFLENCSDLERYLRYGGFVKLNGISVTSATTWLTPEIILCIGSIVIFGMCKKLTTEDIEDGVDNVIKLPKVTPERRLHGLIYSVGKYLALISLCVAAILRPSVQGGFYFLIFLSATTWWACNKKLRKGFAYLLRFVLVVVLFHIIALYAYQFQLPQEKLPRDNRFARYFGLTPLMTVDCNDPRNFLWVNAEWASFLNPFALLWLYFILAMESKLLLMPHVGNVMRQTGLTSEQTPLIRSGASPSRKYGTQPTKATVLQDSTGSVIVTSDGHDDIPMEDLEEDEEEDTPTLIDNIVYAFGACVQVLVRSSYIVTNIIMMAWSITFHSWITFVLLLWANVLWMVPNQRRAMLRCSPFLVIYAWFLLIAAYAFSMNLNNDELPTIINGVELGPIGFEKIEELPCKFLLVKCLYTGMFWITMRQFMKERREARRSSTIADMVAPLQVTVGTAAGVPKKEQKGNEAMQLLGRYIKNFLTKFWIWVVAITLFAVAMVGTRVTGFKIIYMALFLIFILSFQISFRIWRRMMFGFWLVVILYSMLTLVLIYTYQFRSIRGYWKTYVGIDKEQQEDIGLEHYKTRELFIRLVTPTFFVIITVVQLHYFHKDFMDISDPKIGSIIEPSEGSSAQGGIVDHSSMKTDVESSIKFDISQLAHLSSARVQQTVRSFLKQLHRIVNLFYIFMELHLPKFVMLLGMLLCVYDKCAIYLIVVIFIVLSFTLGRPMYIISMFTCSILVSVMLLTRMIYQIHYINHDTWDVNCTDETNSTGVNYTTGNTAEWLGVRKAAADNTLPELVKWNIIFILAVTLWSVVSVRQYNYRLARGWSTKRPYFMFPSIKRADADKNIKNCLKYFLNYGYYKFGIEISLIALVAVIGFRMDVVALIYACWLCILCYVTRTTLSRLWDVFLFFIVIFIPIQYCMVIGFPPNLCLLLPWDTSETLKRLQEWAYLIDRSNSLPAKKLICDFILLLLVSRQAMVFRIERRNVSREYPGGSNESIIHHAEEKGFVNPVPDFITYCRSYLDVLKRTLLLSFMWITLAIVFLAGTNRVTLFSIGYVIGSFIFLWQGQDLYLKPIKKLLVSWDLLLGYNVAVIFIKTATQLAGCVYIETLEKNACWLVQLLAIGCVNKFSGQTGPRMSATCELPRDHIGLVWDGITFACLLLQRRVYSSYNFFHMVNETKATAILASRGADLIEELREKRMKDQDEEERKVLEKIKAKMDRIKRTQQKLHGPAYKDTNNHFVDGIFPNSRPTRMRRPAKTYKEAIRSGDYYMFDDMDDEEIDLEEESEHEEDEFDDDGKTPRSRRFTVGEVSPRSVAIVEPKDKIDKVDKEPQPSTSKDEDDISEMTEPKEQTALQKIVTYLVFIWLFIESALVSITNFLNKYSRDYRYVLRTLNKEKKLLKENTDYNVGLRLGRGQMWQPVGSYHSLLKEAINHPDGSHIDTLTAYEEGELSSVDQPTIIRLCLAIWYLILSHSDILCYFMIFLNQIKTATFLSLPLPLMVFIWGTLSIPRPSKTFWVTIIAYTEIIVLIKCLFQFQILPWNKRQILYPFFPPRIIGVEKRSDYALWDLLLLLIVFFHRFLLKCLGLWKSTYVPAVILSDGDYKITENELRSIQEDPKAGSVVLAGHSGSIQPITLGTARKGSDLQKLVEESEDSVEDETKDEKEDNNDEEDVITVQTEQVNPCTNFATSIRMAVSRYAESMRIFFKELMDPTSRVAVDVYSYMFLCDFFNFFVILIGYSSFGPQQGDEGVQAYLEENRVPVLFLLMLILQFTLIIIDRAIFLRKYIGGKVVFQYIQIVILHIWLFIVYPLITERGFNSVLPPQMYYMVKCFYLLLSAYQIRCGYPTRILGNFICKGYTYLNMFLFKGFMAVPFLFELRTIMDWMWTDTSMTIFDWIKMEDIFAHIFQLKCTRHAENEFPQPRGERKSPIVKYFMGGAGLVLLIAIIWFPLVFFSLGNAVGKSNIPYDLTVDLRIGPYQPIYQMSVQSNSINAFNNSDWDRLLKAYENNKTALTFISNYEPSDVAAIKFSSDSASVWSISPPDRDRMLKEVNSTSPLTIRFQYQVSHKSNTKEDSGIIREEVELILEGGDPVRQKLYEMLSGSQSVPPVELQYILPKFIKVTNKGTAKRIPQLMAKGIDSRYSTLRHVTIDHMQSNATQDEPVKEWWKMSEVCNLSEFNYLNYLSKLPYSDECKSLIMYTFNDKIFPSQLNFIAAGGIIGVYTTIVLVAGRLLRGFFAGMCFKIMFEDMPNVDRVLQLCYDVYLVREVREYCLEEDLFAKLVFLFRSPETLIKWTRPKEEANDEEDEEDDDDVEQQRPRQD